MKHDWPVGETWRASLFLGVLAVAAPAWGDARAIVVEARTQDPARLDGWRATLGRGGASERAAAAFAIGQLGMAWEPPSEAVRARAEAALVDALAGEKDATVRDRIVEGLGKVGGRAALAPLRYRDPASHAALRGCAGDAAVHVRATCAKALADVGGDEDAAALAPLFADRDDRVAAEAARTLTKLLVKCRDSGCRTLRALQNGKLPWRPSVV